MPLCSGGEQSICRYVVGGEQSICPHIEGINSIISFPSV